jgi:hypothetical protein
MRQFLTRPWGKVALAMLATVAAVAVGQGLPSEARADHYQFNVTVEKSPSEGGTVTGDGIDCGTDCTGTFTHAVVCDELGCWDTYSGILSATPAPGYAVEGWTGCQGGSLGVWCFVMGDGSDQTVTARFRKAECSDASDNDSDGKVDHPADPDCESPSDDSEAYTPPPDTTPPPLTVTPESIGPTNDPTPTFEFSSTEESVTFTCLVIDMSDAPVKNNYWVDNCTSPYTTPVLKDGPWRISIWAEDAAGNESPFERRDLTVDTRAPDTTITSGPSGTIRSTTASFGFSSSEPGSTFECSLDGAPFTACTSPKDYSALSQGGHTLEVAATEAAGNRDATPAMRSWNVDSVSGTAPVNATPPTISGTATEGQTLTVSHGDWTGSPEIQRSYQWRRCGSAGANCVDIGAATAATYTLTAADVGRTLRVRETATNDYGTGSADSAPTAAVKSKPGVIAGTVLSKGPKAGIPSASVSCGAGYSATTTTGGSYSILNVAPGRYSCTASASGYRPSTQTVTVASGKTSTTNFNLARS